MNKRITNLIISKNSILTKYCSMISLLLLISLGAGWSQTNPTPQTLPYSEDFAGLLHNSTVYPAGWQGWQVTGNPGASFKTIATGNDLDLIANSAANTTSARHHNYNGKIGFLNGASADLTLVLAINTTGKNDIKVDYDIMTIRNPYDGGSNTRINEVTLQYRVGVSGDFANIDATLYQNNTTAQTSPSGNTNPQNLESISITLPSACDNQPVVQLRWISRQVSGAGSRPSFAVDNISINENTTGGDPDPEPSEHVTNFLATADSGSQITITWTDAGGSQIPTGYLIKAAIDPSTPAEPIDGTPETAGVLIKDVLHGVGTIAFTGLDFETIYNFSIWPYTNSGVDIDYKTDGDIPATTVSTLLPFTNPIAQGLPYYQNFSDLAHNSTVYPAGWQGWEMGSVSSSFNTADASGDRYIYPNATATYSSLAVLNYDGKIGFLNTSANPGDLALVLAVNTIGKKDIKIDYDIMTIRNPYNGSSNTRINEVTLQYRVGTTGSFTNLIGVEYQNSETEQITATTDPQNLENKSVILSSDCNDQAVVQLRWISRQVSGGGTRPSFAVDNVEVTGANMTTTSLQESKDKLIVYSSDGHIVLRNNFESEHHVRVYNASGQQIYSQLLDGYNVTLNRTFNKGVYFIKIDGNKNITGTVIIVQ